MTVYIVIEKPFGGVHQVFDNRAAAELHQFNLTRLGKLTEILERTVNMI